MTSSTASGPAGTNHQLAQAGWRRLAGPLLLVSLMANLLVVGMLAGTFFSGRLHHHQRGAGAGERGLPGFLRTLPAERQKLLFGELEPNRPLIDAERSKAGDARVAALDAFAADPLDPAALKVAFENAHKADLALRKTYSSVLLSIAPKLTVEERRAFRKWREEHHPIRGRRPH